MAEKSVAANRRKSFAGKYNHLRAVRFETKGFKSNEPTPSLAKAAEMHGYNKRLIASQRPTPSVSQ